VPGDGVGANTFPVKVAPESSAYGDRSIVRFPDVSARGEETLVM
jgi:hypothetical protein